MHECAPKMHKNVSGVVIASLKHLHMQIYICDTCKCSSPIVYYTKQNHIGVQNTWPRIQAVYQLIYLANPI